MLIRGANLRLKTLLRGTGLIVGLVALFIQCGGYMLGSSVARDTAFKIASSPLESTLALAPLSLGNPSAAEGPETSPPLLSQPLIKNRSVLPNPVIEHKFSVRKGDTLATVLFRAGVSLGDAHAAVRAFSKKHDPRYIRVGQELKIRYKVSAKDVLSTNVDFGAFDGFHYTPAFDKEVRVTRGGEQSFNASVVDRSVTHHLSRMEGIIQSSLYIAGKKTGLPPAALAELIRAYSWDVDFQRGIQKGDKFEVMFKFIRNEQGKIVRSDEILFAALTLQGQRRTIYRYEDGQGGFEYFDENGNSAQKALMRTPIDGARLSSGFGRRVHPILGYTKMHRGVDFAAPRGTPIFAAGNGIVEMAQRNGGYGKYVRIRHNGTYKTVYAHMSRYGRGIRRGKRVRQGQIIGYVGTTGRSTGNHLHYEILKNGQQRNPMRIKMPSGRKLMHKELTRYHAFRTALDIRYVSLSKGQAIQVSSAN